MEDNAVYCAACEERFVSKYGFCPLCGAQLTSKNALSPVGFAPTIVEEKNVRQRNLLLLATVVLMIAGGLGATVFSIFNKTLALDAIGGDELSAFVGEVDPVSLDPADEVEKNKKKDGGGGGGRGDKDPVQKGREATQTDDPLFSPSKDYTQMTDPELKIRAATQGTKKAPQTDEQYGLRDGGPISSDGQGCCGGQGNSPDGRGQGNDPGNGRGPGKNGGSGNNGIGPNGGVPEDKDDLDSLKVKTGPSEPLKILSKPRAGYTDQARLSMTQGKVVLRVTFLASGEIGGITTVSGLPNGLTEQAVAAARAIKFEPAKVGGKPVTVTKTIEYSFVIF
ncbi:MAG: TonB family protein [Acidobacteria bacterium]|nr:TonB family protein [Acidobacteriota bacterium]